MSRGSVARRVLQVHVAARGRYRPRPSLRPAARPEGVRSLSESSRNGSSLELENLGPEQAPGTTSPRMLVPLFLVPLLIVGVIVVIFLGVGSLVGAEKSVEQWIAEVESGGVNERWQAAANLSDLAMKHPEQLSTPELRHRLRNLFTVAGPEDTRLRQWIAELWTLLDD